MSTPVLEPPSKAITIFGREPAVILGFVEAFLAAFVVFPLGARLGLDGGFVVAFMAALSAAVGVYVAIATRDRLLGYAVGLLKALVALGAYFKFELTAEQTAMLVSLLAAAVGLYQRTQTSPVADPVDPSPPQVVSVAPPADVAAAIDESEQVDPSYYSDDDPAFGAGVGAAVAGQVETVEGLVGHALRQPYSGDSKSEAAHHDPLDGPKEEYVGEHRAPQ